MDAAPTLLAGCAVALGGGALIGIERERNKGAGLARGIAGVRTFTLAGASGAVTQLVDQPGLAAAGALLIAVLAAIAYYQKRDHDPGITTGIALFLTYVLGIAAPLHAQLASAGFVVTAILLASKTRLHRFATQTLTDMELKDGLLLSAAALVVYPLIPNQALAIAANANPHHLWRLIVLLMAVQAAGYVALRAMGAQYGLALAGLASGVVSSSSTFAAMGARAKAEPPLAGACAASALCSNLSSMALLIAVGMTIQPAAVQACWPVLAALVAGSTAAAAAAVMVQPAGRANSFPGGHVFSVRQALAFAALLTALTAAVSLATEWFGTAAAEVGATMAATVDMQAAGAVLFSLSAGGAIDTGALNRSLAFAITANAASKIVIAYAAGGRAYGTRAATGLLLTIAAVWIGAATRLP